MARGRRLTLLRWVLTSVAVAALTLGMVRLARWQWDKHLVRNAQVDRIEANREFGVVPLADVVGRSAVVGRDQEWRLVRVTGRYDPAQQLVVRLRSVSGQGGFEILTPVRTTGGDAVLVDRGLLPVGDAITRPASIPPPPAGEVTVSGYLRRPEVGGSAPVAGVTRRIDAAAIAPTLPYPVLGGYLQLTGSEPVDAPGFVALPPPSTDPGPYLSYAVQWLLFSGLAVGGLGFLAVDELRGGRVRARLRPAQAAVPLPAPAPVARTVRPAVDVLAGGSQRAAALPASFYEEPDEEPPVPVDRRVDGPRGRVD